MVFLSIRTVVGQTPALDSLRVCLANHPQQDPVRLAILISISRKACHHDPYLTKKYAEEALIIAKELNDRKGMADSYREMSRYHWSQTEYNQSIDYLMLALDEYRQLNDLEGISDCYGSLGVSYSQARDYDKAIDYQQRALALNRKINNKSGIARNLNNLGYVFELVHDDEKSLSYYQQALAMRKEMGVRSEIVMPLSNVGSAYLAMGDYDMAASHFREALPIAREVGDRNMEALINQNLGEVHFRKEDYTSAIPFLERSLSIAYSIGDRKRLEETFEILRNVEKSRKNFETAFRYQELLQHVRDTLYSQERTMQLAEIENQVEKEQSEQAIKSLEQDKRVHVLWNNILFVSLLVAVGIFAGLYSWQKHCEKKNQGMLYSQIDLLTLQQKKLTEKYREAITETKDRECESHDQRILKQAIDVVEQNLSNPLFGVEKMAESMNMSRTNLHRKLKSVSGFAPSDFIRQVRLKHAASLIKNQADTISQIAFIVGFEDQSYFSKAFKKQFGITPSQYAHQHDLQEVR